VFCLVRTAGDPFHPDTPDPWSDSPAVRSSAQVHDERFRVCVALQAQYMYDTFGKFAATIPSVHMLMYLQAHHLDLDFYDAKFSPGAYMRTHEEHLERWHGEEPHFDRCSMASARHERKTNGILFTNV
jgi:hypothetical protein